MYTPFWIAKRYFAAGKKKHLVYKMGLIACLSVAISTTALLVVLSVFNGLEGIIRQLFYAFEPDLKVQLAEGRYFSLSSATMEDISAVSGVAKVVETLEENALFAYNNKQIVGRIKGVSTNFLDNSPLEPYLIKGQLQFEQEGQACAVVGLGIQHALSININNTLEGIQVFCPRPIPERTSLMQKFYHKSWIKPDAIFAVEKSFDDEYVLTSLDFVKKLLQMPDKLTALEIQIKQGFPIDIIQKKIKNCFPPTFLVLNRDQQQMTLFRALNIEKLLVFTAFSFIVLIASLNIFFILFMLVLSKKSDIVILHTLGMPVKSIKYIFIWEGLLIGLVGAFLGMAIAFLLTWLQETFGIVSLGMKTSLIKAYPVKRQVTDFILVSIGVFITTLGASYKPASWSKKLCCHHKNIRRIHT